MKRKIARILLYVFLGITLPHARGGKVKDRCKVALSTASTSLRMSLANLQNTYGMRALLAPSKLEPVNEARGFIRRQGPVQNWVLPIYPLVYPIRTLSYLVHLAFRWDTKYFRYPSIVRGILKNIYVAPVEGLATKLLREPVLRLFGDKLNPEMREFLSQKLMPSGIMDFVLAAVSFRYIYGEINEWNEKFSVEKQNSWIEEDSDYWMSLLENDPYYSRLKYLYEEHQLEKKEAVQEAFLRASSLDLLYMLVNDQHDYPEGLPTHILNDPELKEAFKPILPATFYLEEFGPLASADFKIPASQLKPAKAEKMEWLIQNNLNLMKRRSLIRAYFENYKLFEELSANTTHELYSKKIFKDPQIQFYISELGAKHISLTRARYLMLEWIQILERFERWEIFQAKRRVNIEGKEFLSLEDVLAWRRLHLLGDLPHQFLNVDIYPAVKINNRQRLERPLSSYLNKLVFLRSIEPGMRQFWNSFESSVRFMGQGSARAGITGEKVMMSTGATGMGAQAGAFELKGAGNFARGMAVLSSAVVYADIYIRWNDLKSIKTFVKRAGIEVFYINE